MTTFRTGDVVKHENLRGSEGTVRTVRERTNCNDIDVTWTKGPSSGSTLATMQMALTLLRRPLRVGDPLRTERGSWTWTKATEDSVKDADRWVSNGWTHEDGTPIDVPRAECAGREPDPVTAIATPGRIRAEAHVEVGYLGDPGPQKRVIIDGLRAEANADMVRFAFPIGDTETFVSFDGKLAHALGENGREAWEVMAHEVRAMLEVVSFDQRANRLSDECGALASANRELLVENAVLRRENERLARKARR